MYTYTVIKQSSRGDELRGLLGVDTSVLPDSVIDLLPILPAAELAILKLVPTAASLTGNDQLRIRLAVLYEAAANALPRVRLNVIQLETDSKSTYQLFKNALDLDESDLRAKARGLVEDVQATLGETTDHGSLFTVVKPATDEVSGDANS